MPDGAETLCERFINGDAAGTILVAAAETDELLLGVLTLSIQEALRAGGPYAEIQEL